MAGHLRLFAGVWVSMALAGLAQAGDRPIIDPMRPPAVVDPRSNQAANDASSGARPHLQALRLRAQKPIALIDGRWMGLGEMLGGARIAAIDEQGVVLRRDGATERLRPLPDLRPVPGTTTANSP